MKIWRRAFTSEDNQYERRLHSPLGSTFLPPRWVHIDAFWLDKRADKLFATILEPEVEVNARAIFPTAKIEVMADSKTNQMTGSPHVQSIT